MSQDDARPRSRWNTPEEAESYYRQVIDSAIDGFFAIDAQRRFVEVNDRLCELFGYPREEWLGRTPLDFITEESRAELIRQMQRIDTSDRRRYQLVAQRKDGSTFPILLNNSTHRNAQGEVTGSFGFITDLTPIFAAQQAVVESEHELRGILDDLQDTYYRTDQSGVIVRASRSVEQLLGYTVEEVLGRRLADLYCSQGDRDDFLARMLANGGHIVGGESRLRHKDGREVWVLTTAHFIRDAAGNVVGVEGTTRDNTRQRLVEQQLRLAAKVFESSGEAIMITDPGGVIISVNQAFTAVTGYAAADVAGRNASLLASGRHPPEFFADLWQQLGNTGYWQGEIWNRRRNGEIFPEWLGISSVRDERGVLVNYVGIFSDISERKAAAARIEYLAQHDTLTGLPNRLLLKDRMAQAIALAERSGRRVALLFVDLDRFKAVNDSYGHPVGDILLRDAAVRLQSCVRESDTVSRHGGDEFLVVLNEVQDSQVPAQVAAKIMSALSQTFRIEGHEASISASVGIAVYPDDGADFDELLKKADTAMYHAKEAGRNAFRFHTQPMNVAARQRVDLHARLREALGRDEFELYYQPTVALDGGKVVGGEALLRWRVPGDGVLDAGQFIAAAEHGGLIVPLGEWVLHQACRELARWQKAGRRDLALSVNVSPVQFRRGDVEDTLRRALAATAADPVGLELEFGELVLAEGSESVCACLGKLKALGLRLVIDDYGSGSSSLSALKRFGIDALKIDRAFVGELLTQPDSANLVRAAIGIAANLGLRIQAEGVESDRIASELRAMGCTLAQGYGLGRPLPAAQFRQLIGID
ncbi:MAG: PAS domain S-box protein [Rhodocyclales bacterium]|nr:PAS domain S-box protein [Rhodocyclales bacterium]